MEELKETIVEFIKTHLDPSHESSYKRGSSSWTDSKWIAVISYKVDVPKGQGRTFRAFVTKEVSRIKSNLNN